MLDVAAALERPCNRPILIALRVHMARSFRSYLLSHMKREGRRLSTVLSPPLAHPSRLYFMPPRTGRSKRGSTNVEASHVKRCRAVQTSTPSPTSLAGSTLAGELDQTSSLTCSASPMPCTRLTQVSGRRFNCYPIRCVLLSNRYLGVF